jgi:hypothetical protein
VTEDENETHAQGATLTSIGVFQSGQFTRIMFPEPLTLKAGERLAVDIHTGTVHVVKIDEDLLPAPPTAAPADAPPDKLYKKPQAAELPEKHWSPHHDATHLTGNFRCCVNGVDMGDEWEIIVQPGHDYVFTAAPADAPPQTAPPAD